MMPYLKKNKTLRLLYRLYVLAKESFVFAPLRFARGLRWVLKDYRYYKKSEKNPNFNTSTAFFYPCINDKSDFTPIEPIYFFQDAWFTQKVFAANPEHHYDVGSSVKTIAILAGHVPVTMIDIRPPELTVKNLHFKKGSILDMPFESESIKSLSSICVVEHIGLGRYGDPIDPWGSEKAFAELKRILAPGGDLYFTVPVDAECRVYFNAHRSFTRSYILQIFADMSLTEEKYLYGTQLFDRYDAEKGFGTGFYHFTNTLTVL